MYLPILLRLNFPNRIDQTCITGHWFNCTHADTSMHRRIIHIEDLETFANLVKQWGNRFSAPLDNPNLLLTCGTSETEAGSWTKPALSHCTSGMSKQRTVFCYVENNHSKSLVEVMSQSSGYTVSITTSGATCVVFAHSLCNYAGCLWKQHFPRSNNVQVAGLIVHRKLPLL